MPVLFLAILFPFLMVLCSVISADGNGPARILALNMSCVLYPGLM